MTVLPPKPGHSLPSQASRDGIGDVNRAAYVFANNGLIGLAGWLLRGRIRAATARYVTGPVALTAMAAVLVLLAIGNTHHIRPLSIVAGWGLLIIPLAWLMGWTRRTKEEAWALEHGRDTTEFRAELEADERRQDREVTKHDWLVDPPWKHRSEQVTRDRRPQFGRKMRS